MKKINAASYILLLSTVIILSAAVYAQVKKPMTVEDLWSMKRIGGLMLSPDGKTLAFTVTSYSMDENKGDTDIYLVNSDGTGLRPFLSSDKSESEPVFSPDGKSLCYVKDDQIWTIKLDGTGDAQVTDIYTGASGMRWTSDGKKILFVSAVYPECNSPECNKAIDEKKEAEKTNVKVFTELMYRHWNDWRGEKRSHLFLFYPETKQYIDLTPNSTSDVPPLALGSANDYGFSPDGNEVVYTTNTAKMIATSTNNDIFLLDISKLKTSTDAVPSPKLIAAGLGNDFQPVYSPDGKYIAFCSMKRPGFEADKHRLFLYTRATGEMTDLTADTEYSPTELLWSPDSRSIYFNGASSVAEALYRIDIASKTVTPLYDKHVNGTISISPDNTTLYFQQQRIDLPTEVFALKLGTAEPVQLTKINEAVLNRLAMTPLKTIQVSVPGAIRPIESILLTPPDFDPAKKYPMLLVVHGGPQGNWNDEFHYRWNMQMFAAQGYVVVAPNPTGSTGYGQAFTDGVTGDWGGQPYRDIIGVCDYVIANFPYVDSKNQFAIGASYGGYMINWMATQTDRFNTLVSHAGVFNLESMYGTTEELWFSEWEYRGTPWENRAMYVKFSPHQYVKNIKTPMLVSHGGMDFRVPEEQAFQLFTSLQRLGIESEFMYFPKETHFVQKPQNARFWWNKIFSWFIRFRK